MITMDLIYQKATVKDIDILTKTRIEVLRATNQLFEDTDMSEVERHSRDYYNRSLLDGTAKLLK